MSSSTSNPLTQSVEMSARNIADKVLLKRNKKTSPAPESPQLTRKQSKWDRRPSYALKLQRDIERKNIDIPRRESEVENTGGKSTECISYSECGKYLASGGEDKAIHIYTSENLKPMSAPFECHSSVESLDFSMDGRILCSGHKDGQMILWHLDYEGQAKHHGNSGKVIFVRREELNEHTGEVKAVKFSPKGDKLASGGSDNELIVWNLKKGDDNRDKVASHYPVRAKVNAGIKAKESKKATLATIFSSQTSFAYNEDGQLDEPQQPKSSERLSENVADFQMHKESITCISWDQNEENEYIATGSKDDTVRVWDLADKDNIEVMILEGHEKDVRDVAFSPDGQSLASVGGSWVSSDGAEIRIWDMRGEMLGDEEQSGIIEGHEMGVTSVVWSDDGKMICTGSFDQTIRFWTVENGKCFRTIINEGAIRALAAGLKQRYIAIGDSQGTVRKFHFTYPIDNYEKKLHRAFKAGGLEMEKLIKTMVEDKNEPLSKGGIYLIVEYLLHNTEGDDMKLFFDTLWTVLQEYDEEKTNDDDEEAKKALDNFIKLEGDLKDFFAHVEKFNPNLLKYLSRNLDADGELQKVAETEIMRVAMDLFARGGVLQIYYGEIVIYSVYMMCFATSTISLKFKHEYADVTVEDRLVLEANEYVLIATSLYFMFREFYQIYKEFFQHWNMKDFIIWVNHHIMLNLVVGASFAVAMYYLVLTMTSDEPKEAWFQHFVMALVGSLILFTLNTLGFWEFIDVASPAGSLGIIAFFVRYGPGEDFDHLASSVAVINWVKFLNVIRGLNKDISTFILMIEFILEDILSFIFVQVIVMIMFGHALYLELAEKDMHFHDQYSSNPYSTIWVTAQTLVKTLFGDFDSTVYSYDYVMVLFLSYMFMVIIIMLNVLIAIVSDSYSRAMSQSTELYFKSRLLLIVEMKTTFNFFLKLVRKMLPEPSSTVVFNLEKKTNEDDVWDDRMQEIADKVTAELKGKVDEQMEYNQKLMNSNEQLQKHIVEMNKKLEMMDLHVLGKMKKVPLSTAQKSFSERDAKI
ncbi:hypothetical protein TrST_g5059 [Triparma strigata]|uniref:Polycystin cation channel PKD1/PKD2 domain-containing protein n=1 Tax=Triparma strigata TaxID=1606541 RepID=A0A9W7B1L4_9STRA|nr:hypothetical protein TrST_g5059 [Triparma strigata]